MCSVVLCYLVKLLAHGTGLSGDGTMVLPRTSLLAYLVPSDPSGPGGHRGGQVVL